MIDLKKIEQYAKEGKLFEHKEALQVLGNISPTTLRAMVRRGEVKLHIFGRGVRGYKITPPHIPI